MAKQASDHKAVSAVSGVAIELNAHPYRLDIDWRLCKYAKERKEVMSYEL